jgi:hypothetical protein
MENIYSKKAYLRSDGIQQKNYYVKNPYSDVEFSVKVTKDQYGSEDVAPYYKVNKIVSVSVYATVKFPATSLQEPITVHMESFPNLKIADAWISLARLSGTNICKDKIENCLLAAKGQGVAGNVGNCIYYSKQAAVWAVLKEEKHLDKETAERYAS